MPTPILEVNALKLTLNPSFLADRPKEVVRSVSFRLERGQSLAILGQTASGKSLLLRSLSRFFHELPIREVDGAVLFEGKNLLRTSQSRLLSLRGSRIAHILQDAHALFNPRITIRQHFDLILRIKQRKRTDPVEHTIRHLYRVGIVEPEALLQRRIYPEELDTATRQKLMIASALVCEPHLLIADEPTAEFDSGTVASFVELLEQLKKDNGLAVVVATGRVRRAEQFGDRIAVLDQGELVECSTPRELFNEGQHLATRSFAEGTLLAGSGRERLLAHRFRNKP
jgi:ABC-type glutathione transport system ATPase component